MSPQALQTGSQIAILVGIVVTGVGGYGAYHFGKVIEGQRESDEEKRETKLRSDIDRLLSINESLQQTIEPFEVLARELHPTLSPDEALDKLRDDLRVVEQRAAALEQRVAPLNLSPQQQQLIRQLLHKVPPRFIDITSVAGNTEAFELAGQLKESFEDGGWKVDGINQSLFSILTCPHSLYHSQ